MPVYLIHFDEPFKHAEHYIGFVTKQSNLSLRMDHHKNGRGARLMDAVSKAGIDWRVVRYWPKGDRTFERRLKGRSAKRYCPICTPSQSKETFYGKLKSKVFK